VTKIYKKYDKMKSDFLNKLGNEWVIEYTINNDNATVIFNCIYNNTIYMIVTYDIHESKYTVEYGNNKHQRISKQSTITSIINHVSRYSKKCSVNEIPDYRANIKKISIVGSKIEISEITETLFSQPEIKQQVDPRTFNSSAAIVILVRDYIKNALASRMTKIPTQIEHFISNLTDWIKIGYFPSREEIMKLRDVLNELREFAKETDTMEDFDYIFIQTFTV